MLNSSVTVLKLSYNLAKGRDTVRAAPLCCLMTHAPFPQTP